MLDKFTWVTGVDNPISTEIKSWYGTSRQVYLWEPGENFIYYKPYNFFGVRLSIDENTIPAYNWCNNYVILRKKGNPDTLLHARLHEFGHVLQYQMDPNVFKDWTYANLSYMHIKEIAASMFAAILCKEFGYDPDPHIAHVNLCLGYLCLPINMIGVSYAEAVQLHTFCLERMGSSAKELFVEP